MKNAEIKDVNEQLRKINSPIKVFRCKMRKDVLTSEWVTTCSGKHNGFKCDIKIKSGLVLSRYRDDNYGQWCQDCILKQLDENLESHKEKIKAIENTTQIIKMHKDQFVDSNLVESL